MTSNDLRCLWWLGGTSSGGAGGVLVMLMMARRWLPAGGGGTPCGLLYTCPTRQAGDNVLTWHWSQSKCNKKKPASKLIQTGKKEC